jgi:predicted RNA polymerase sigma factor
MVSYLTRIFGVGRLDLAEDVVQDTLCRALEMWPVQGFPDNPSAWLMRVARNRAAELKKIPDPARLKDYPFYPAAQGEFHLVAGRPAEAAKHFEKAMQLARSRSETNFFERKLKACQPGTNQ